jgi:hypothetical protein
MNGREGERRTNGLDVNGREQVLENGRHELELLVLSSESTQDQLQCTVSVLCATGERLGRAMGASANSLPTLLGLLAILKTSLARLYRKTLKLRVGPLGSLMRRKLRVVVPSMRLRSARSSASCFADFFDLPGTAVGVGRTE